MRASVIIPVAGLAHHSPMTQKCVAGLRQHHPAVKIRVLERVDNIYAAWNQGAQQSGAEALIFLNNDTITHAPWIDTLLAGLNERVRIVGVSWRTERSLPVGHIHQGQAFLEGWCFACTRETWANHGFDEDFGLYFGDTDFQARVNSDMEAVVLGQGTGGEDIRLRHIGHQSTQLRPDRREQWKRDRATFLKKWPHKSSPWP